MTQALARFAEKASADTYLEVGNGTPSSNWSEVEQVDNDLVFAVPRSVRKVALRATGDVSIWKMTTIADTPRSTGASREQGFWGESLFQVSWLGVALQELALQPVPQSIRTNAQHLLRWLDSHVVEGPADIDTTDDGALLIDFRNTERHSGVAIFFEASGSVAVYAHDGSQTAVARFPAAGDLGLHGHVLSAIRNVCGTVRQLGL